MASYEHLDLLLGQALECINDAGAEIKDLSIYNQKELLKHIGQSVSELWEVRNAIYEIKPEIKREFVKEYSQDKQRYDDLNELHKKAYAAEDAGAIETAEAYYRRLLSISKFGFFKLVAEAGLYRLSETKKT